MAMGDHQSGQEPQPPAGDAVTTIRVGRAIQGDRASVDWLIERFSPALLAQASWRLGKELRRHADPEDLVAEAWMCLLPKLADVPARDGRITPVVLRFLATTILYRVNALAKKHLRADALRAIEPGEPARGDVSAAVRALVRTEAHEHLQQALAALTDEEREIVMLRGIEQHQNQVVAELLQITPGAAAMRYLRALRRLRGLLPATILDDLPEDAPSG